MLRLLLPTLLVFLSGCGQPPATESFEQRTVVRTGAHQLHAEMIAPLRGKRVGLITNHTAMVDTTHLIDVFNDHEDVTLVALFGPEHGIRGAADAGAQIEHGRDERTGVPIFSLYGQTRKPTPEMLRDTDVLVFDIQDIGARFYTYISTMGLAMQAAAEAGLSFVVLDRPNPLGGELVSGFVLERGLESFVGQYPIPVVHGLTVGELARMIQGEGMLSGLQNLDLHVVQMEGWRRDMYWAETGLPWISPSPNIPDFETALIYPGACFFEGTTASEGRGTREPFKLVGAPWADGEALATSLNERNLPGVRFEVVTFTPRSIEGMSASPKLLGQPVGGVRHIVTDVATFRPVDTGIHVLHAFYHQAPAQAKGSFFNDFMRRLAGTQRLQQMITADATPEEIISAWQPEVSAFEQRRAAYLLYD